MYRPANPLFEGSSSFLLVIRNTFLGGGIEMMPTRNVIYRQLPKNTFVRYLSCPKTILEKAELAEEALCIKCKIAESHPPHWAAVATQSVLTSLATKDWISHACWLQLYQHALITNKRLKLAMKPWISPIHGNFLILQKLILAPIKSFLHRPATTTCSLLRTE